VVTFDHREPGTPESAWVAAGVLDRCPDLDLDGVDELVVLAAHPDDETFGAAGLVHRVAARGGRVTVVVATDGESSHPDSSTFTQEQLRDLRRREVATAVGRLAPGARVVLLALPDGALREQRQTLTEQLDRVLRQIIEEIVETVETDAPDDPDAAAPASLGVPGPGTHAVLLAAPWRGDGHRDHRVAGEVAAELARAHGLRLVEYPVWMWHWADPASDDVPWDALRAVRLTVAERATKGRALAEHHSQVEPLSPAPGDESVLGPEMVRHAQRAVELFVTRETGAGDLPSLRAEFFDDFYRGRDDPWGFETRWYEERKRAVLLAALPRPRFRSALEVGCSTGVLTAELARRCDQVVGVDVAADPLRRARQRLGTDVQLEQLRTPDEWPDGTFDLIVLSEVLYYSSADDVRRTLDRTLDSLAPDGVVVVCHWRHEVREYPLSGDDAQRLAVERPELGVLVHHEEEDFLLDVLARRPVVSVARDTGLA
jgi:LmbE family N-acetylglucosaminyl deacetylase/protein-L-isoaspartate O-methyltransferase